MLDLPNLLPLEVNHGTGKIQAKAHDYPQRRRGLSHLLTGPAPEVVFRGSMVGLHAPLSTLPHHP